MIQVTAERWSNNDGCSVSFLSLFFFFFFEMLTNTYLQLSRSKDNHTNHAQLHELNCTNHTDVAPTIQVTTSRTARGYVH